MSGMMQNDRDDGETAPVLHVALPDGAAVSEATLAGLFDARLPDVGVTLHPDLAQALKAVKTGRIVVPLPLPEEAVALRLGAGQTPAAALRDWMQEADTLLALLRRARRRVLLVPLFGLQAQDQTLWTSLAEQQGLPSPAPATDPPAAPIRRIDRLMAGLAIATAPDASARAEEILAMSLGAPAPAGLAEISEGWTELAGLAAETDRLRTELQDMAAERRSLDQSLDLAGETIAALEAQLIATEAARREAQTRGSQQVADLETALAASRARQAEMSAGWAELAGRATDADRLRTELQDMAGERRTLDQSLDLTGKMVVALEAQLIATEAARREAQTRGSQQAADLETALAASRARQAEIAQLGDALAQATERQKELQQDLKNARDALAQQEAEQAALQEERGLLRGTIGLLEADLGQLLETDTADQVRRSLQEFETLVVGMESRLRDFETRYCRFD